MKNIYYILGTALVIITACMIYITFKGVGLRTEPIIKPSVVDEKLQNVVFGISHRLFPSFKTFDYVVWGIDTDISTEEGQVFELLRSEHLSKEGQNPSVLNVDSTVTESDIKNCAKPCWIVLDKDKASDVSQSTDLEKVRAALGKNHFTITYLPFSRGEAVPEECESQKRLQYNCIKPISIREAKRFMKEESTRYFFMRGYNEVDYFLFVENK